MKKALIGMVVGMLAVLGVMGGAALAQSADGDTPSALQSFAERVAAILGLETEDVEDAFKQAREDMEDARVDSWVAEALEADTITQEQADWLNAVPAVPLSSLAFAKTGNDIDAYLAKMVESGKMTQAGSDAYAAWLATKPDGGIPLFGPKRGDRGFGHGRGHRGGFGHGFGGTMDAASEIAEAVAAGKITQEQADWLNARPDNPLSRLGVRTDGDAVDATIADAVAAGRVSQAEADAYTEWIEAKPEGDWYFRGRDGDRFGAPDKGRGRGGHGGRFGGWPRKAPAPETTVNDDSSV